MDLISRQEAIKKILLCENHDMEHDFEFNQGLIVAMNAIEELPTANPSTTLMKVEVGVDKESLRKAMEEAELTFFAEPRKGRWEIDVDCEYSVFDIVGERTWAIKATCSECGFTMSFIEGHGVFNYCPNCGARMEEANETD